MFHNTVVSYKTYTATRFGELPGIFPLTQSRSKTTIFLTVSSNCLKPNVTVSYLGYIELVIFFSFSNSNGGTIKL